MFCLVKYKEKMVLEKNEETDEIKSALDLMENSDKHVFLTGKAGTGKSTLLRHFCDTTKKKIVVVAPTGIAALNARGVTINSFFQLGFGVLEKSDIHYLFKKQKIFRNLDVLVIDEISMVRSDMMNAIDYSLRLNTGYKDLPFGGVQVIMFGDLYQLPPVVMGGGDEKSYLDDRYDGVYFFNAPVFGDIDLKKIELTKNFRQKDSSFIELLNKVRENRLNQSDLRTVNKRVCQYDSTQPAITLAPTNSIVNAINKTQLDKINKTEETYRGIAKGGFPEKDYPAEEELRLKVGAQIMMIKNDISSPRRWVNGSLGVIEKLEKDHILVRLDGVRQKVERVKWEVYDYNYKQEEKTIVKKSKGSFLQFPIKLAWSVTIHKSQGKTFDRAIIDMGNGAWLHGQAYVALSRCSSFEGMYLKRGVRFTDIVVDQVVANFHKYK